MDDELNQNSHLTLPLQHDGYQPHMPQYQENPQRYESSPSRDALLKEYHQNMAQAQALMARLMVRDNPVAASTIRNPDTYSWCIPQAVQSGPVAPLPTMQSAFSVPPPHVAQIWDPTLHHANQTANWSSLADIGQPVSHSSPFDGYLAPEFPDEPNIYSRKVFVGGLPLEVGKEHIEKVFSQFGALFVDWPFRLEGDVQEFFPPRGYVFLIYDREKSVHSLVAACRQIGEDTFFNLCSANARDKAVQVRPWRLSDADYVPDPEKQVDPRKTVFTGGIPRTIVAEDLAMILDKLFGGVVCASVDVDPELMYPKGAGRVTFNSQHSYTSAIATRFVQASNGEEDKRIEVKPYVMDEQMCDECLGSRCGAKYAKAFCSSIKCLQYYCQPCWDLKHSKGERQNHELVIKLHTATPVDQKRARVQHWIDANQ